MIQQFVVDTNVVVSGVLAGAEESPNRRILDAMVDGRMRFLLSEVLLAEYREVLLRPAIAQRHGLIDADVDALLEELVLNAALRETPTAEVDALVVEMGPSGVGADPPAPGDEHIVALLSIVPGAILVTGDRRLREAVTPWRQVLTPAELAAALA